MANKQGRIGFSVDFKKGDQSGLRDLRTQLESLQQISVKDIINTGNLTEANQKLGQVQETAKKVQQALEDSYNAKLDTTDLNKFQKLLKDQGLNLQAIKKDFAEAGIQGQIAFRNLNTELLTTNKYAKQTSQWLDKMAETLSNTVRWSIASTAVNSITGSIQKAYSFTKQLDSSLNDIRIVTEKSADDMDRFARKANEAAKALGAQTLDYTKASLIFYQQGLSDEEVASRANVTTKVANVTRTSADVASEQLTAIWNGYKVQAQEAELYIDKVAAVAASTAADLEELSVGMSKVASAANIMGVDIDQLNAQLATIVSVTREAPESIGTALKTVYARMSDIEAGLDSETSLGEYTKQMAEMGINALDAKGNLRDMGEVVEEIGNKWSTLNRNQQTSLAQIIAGTRQYSRMTALFDNWDMYQQSKATSQGSAGALQKQNEIYLDSMEAHLNQLSAAADGLYDSLLDPEGLNKIIDGLTKVVELVDNMVQGLGGGGNLLLTLGSIGVNVFSNQISRGITSTIRNTQGLISNLKNANAQAELFQEILNANADDSRFSEVITAAEKLRELSSLMTDEEKEQVDLLLQKKVEMLNQEKILEEQKQHAENIYKALTGEEIDISAKGGLDTLQAEYKDAFKHQDISFLDDLNELVDERQQISNMKRAHKRYSNIADKSQYTDTTTSTVVTEGVEYEFESVDLSEKTLSYRAKAAEKELEIQEALEEQSEKLKEFFDINLKGIQITDQELEVFKSFKIFDESELEELEVAQKLLAKINKEGSLKPEDLKAAQKAFINYQKAVDKSKIALKQAGEGAINYSKKIDLTKESLDRAEKSLTSFIKSLDMSKAVDSVVKLAGGATNVLTAFNNIKNIGSIWSDETLTGGEKLLQTLSNVSFTIPMIVSGISNLREGWSSASTLITGLKDSYLAWNTAAAAKIVLNKAEDKQVQSRIFWDSLYEECKDNLSEAQKNEYEQILNTTGALSGEQIAKLKSIVGDGLKTVSLKKVAGAAKEAGAAFLKMSIQFLTSPVGLILLTVAAAVTAVTIAAKIGAEQYNKYTLAMQKASEAAEHQKQAYEDVKKAHEDLKNSISNYDEAQEAIDKMVEGTQEWRDAIIEANRQVTDLIQKYPQLARYLNKESNGRLTLDETGLEIAQQESQRAVNTAYGASLAANASANIAKNNAVAESISHNTDYATFGSVFGGWIKSLNPLFFLGEAIAKQDGFSPYENETSTKDITAIANALNAEENIGKTFEEVIKNTLGDVSKAQVNALLENKDAIEELSIQIKNNNEINSALNEQIMSTWAQNNSAAYRNTEYQAQVDAVAGAQYAEVLDKWIDEYADKIDGRFDADIQEEYAAMMVETGQWQSKLSVKNKNGNKGEYSYIDASGQTVSVEIDDLVARTALATYHAQKDAGTDINKIVSAVEKVASSGNDKVDAQLANLISKREVDLTELTQAEKEQFEKLASSIKLSEEELSVLGIDSIKSISDNANTAFEKLGKLFEDYEKLMFGENKDIYDSLFTESGAFYNSDLTTGGKLNIAQIFSTNDNALINPFINIITQLGENADDFVNALPGLETAEDLATFEENLLQNEKLAYLVREDLFDEFVDNLQTNFELFNAYSRKAAQEQAKVLNGLQSKLQNVGDTISAEDFEAAGLSAYEEYFTTMSDGTKMLTRDALDFWRAVTGDQKKKAREEYEDAVTKRNNIEVERKRLQEQLINTPAIDEIYTNYVGKTQNEFNIFRENVEKRTPGEYDLPTAKDHVRKELLTLELADPNNEYVQNFKQRFYNGETTVKDWLAFDEYYQSYDNGKKAEIQDELGKLPSSEDLNAEVANAASQILTLLSPTELTALYGDPNISFDEINEALDVFMDVKASIMADLVDPLEAQDRVLKNLTRDYDKLNSELDKMTGEDRLDQYDTILTNLEDQETSLRNQYNDVNNQRNKFKNYLTSSETGLTAILGPEFKFETNEDGSLKRKDSIIAQIQAQMQLGSLDQTTGNHLLTAIEKYEDYTLNVLPGILDSIDDSVDEQYNTRLAKLEESFEQNLKPEETLKAYNDFLRQLADENDFGKLGEYALNDFALTYSQMEDTVMHIKEIQESNLEPADKERLILEKQNELQEYYLSLKEQIVTLNELQLSQLNEISEGYDTICDTLSQMNDLLENQRQLHELIYGADSESLEAFYEADLALMQGQLATRREEYNKFKEEYENATDEGVKEEARAQMLEAAQNIASLSAELAQAQVDNFKRQTENRVRALFEGIDSAKAEWDWLENESEDTMDLLTGMLKVGALRQTIEKEISSSNSLTKQAKLNQFLEDEIALLEQKDELTKYDLERAQARYDLRLAEIALEEAQANKSKMQLRRRSDGTYSYEYVTDENAIAEQQKAVFEAQQAALEVDQQQFKTNVESLYEFTQEFIDTYISAFEDNKLGEDEQAQVRRVFSSILARVGDTGEIVENLRETMQEAAQKLGLENFEDLSNAEMKELFPMLDSGMYNIIRSFAAGGLTEASLNTLLGQSTEDLGALVSLLSTLGLNAEQFGFTKGADGWTFGGTVGDAYGEIRNEQNTAIQEGTTAMTNLRDAVDKATSAFDSVKTSVENFIGAIAADGSGNRVEYEEGETPMEALARAFWTAVNNLGVDSKILSTEGYDTGGYTGAWGRDGRLALLHEKELVLNADDTRNILNSVAFVRDLGVRLNDSMMSALLELASSRPSLSTLDTLQEQLTLEQNVHITAEFPNVDSQAEIEAAFEELINLATQKALENK